MKLHPGDVEVPPTAIGVAIASTVLVAIGPLTSGSAGASTPNLTAYRGAFLAAVGFAVVMFDAVGGDEHAASVEAWARDVWGAWAAHHETVRGWLDRAVSSPRRA